MQKTARQRLLDAADPAAARLVRALDSLDERVAIKAAQLVLDRAGCHPAQTVQIEDHRAELARLLGVRRGSCRKSELGPASVARLLADLKARGPQPPA